MTATVGIDLASQAAGTAVCAIAWDGRPTVAALMRGVIDETSKTPLDDKMIASVMRTDHGAVPAVVTKIAIEAPFGWPAAFVDALAGRDSARCGAAVAHSSRAAPFIVVAVQTERGAATTGDPTPATFPSGPP